MTTSSRLGLLRAVAVIALSAGFTGTAIAQNQAEVEFNNTAPPADIITVINTITPGPQVPPVIVTLQTIAGFSSGISSTTGSFVLSDDIAGDNSSFAANANLLTARTRGNNADSSLGYNVNSADNDGAMILAGQQTVPDATDVITLAATIDVATVGYILYGDSATNVSATVNGNQAQAYTTFNSNFSTIDVAAIPAGLNNLAGSYEAAWDLGAVGTATYFVTDIDQTANFNVTSAQANFGFANGQTDPALATSNVDDVTVVLAYLLDDTTPDQEMSGTFSVDGNGAQALTQGNATDLSIFLFDSGASTLGGSAMVSTTQSSSDSTEPAGEFPGISAANTDTSIGAVFAAEPQTFPPTLPINPSTRIEAVNLDASVSGNTISSSATANSGRNFIGLEGTLDVSNDADPASESNINVGAGTNAGVGATEVDAQVSVVNNQTAASSINTSGGVVGQLINGSNAQAAVANTEDALIGLGVEDVEDSSTLALSSNAISATANGQFGSNTIVNNGNIVDPATGNVTNLGAGTANIDGTFASLNRQVVVRPEISAEVSDSTITALIGSAGDLAAVAFGGLAGSTLTVGDDAATATVNEGNRFQAIAAGSSANATIDLRGTTITAVGTGVVETENNQDLADFTFAQSNAGINMVNWQFTNLAGDDDQGSIFASLDDVDIEVFVNYAQGEVGTNDAIEISSANVNVNGNGGTASASLNDYSATANVNTALGFEGTIAQLSHQYTSGVDISQYTVESEVVSANISVDLGVNGAAEDINASVSGNTYLSLTSGNNTQQALTMNAGNAIAIDADTIAGDNAVIADNVQNPNIVTRVTDIEAAAAFIAVTDQTLRATIAESRVEDLELELLLAAPAGGTNSLTGSVLSLSGNAAVAQVVGNNASNSVSVTAANSITPLDGSGAIAGAVSSQSSVAQTDDLGPTGLDAESSYEAEVLGAWLHADVMTEGVVQSISDVTLAMTGNGITALTRGNSVTNTVSATSPDLNAAVTTGALLETGNGANDMNLTVDDSALYVLNRQRNEGNDTRVTGAGVGELGPSVSSFLDNNVISATLNGGVLGADTVVVNLSSNAMQSAAAGSAATNTININAGTTQGTADASAGILNRQGNSGNITAEAGDDANGQTIQASILGADGAAHVDLTLNVNNNEISGTATGNVATNAIVAKGGSLNGTVGDGLGSVYIGASAGAPADQIGAVLTDTNTSDSNADAFVTGNLAILNTQFNYGLAAAGDSPERPNTIGTEVENNTLSLDIIGDVTTSLSALNLSGNQVRSQAGANQATNSISLLPTSGQPGFASVLNNQGVALTNVSAGAFDNEVTLNVDGAFDTGTTAVNNNAVIASASLNTASNTVTAQSTIGSLPGATVINYQTASDSSVSATNSGTQITHSSSGLAGGTFSTSSSTVSGNQIGSSATINNSTNTISSPGQTFTRTSSF